MNLHLLEIPDETRTLARWLEGHVVGPTLPQLAAELAAERKPLEIGESDAFWTTWGAQIDRTGLSELSRETLAKFLRHSELLLELQERVFDRPSRYWDEVIRRDPEVAELTQRVYDAVLQSITNPEIGRNEAHQQRWYQAPWALAGAAAVLLAAGTFFGWSLSDTGRSGTQIASGWSRSGAIPEDSRDARSYLNQLAENIGWPREAIPDRRKLADELLKIRAGCTALLLAEQRPLTIDDRKWLRGKCRAWAQRIDWHLQQLEEGSDPAMVYRDANQTVMDLTKALRARADLSGGQSPARA